MIYGCLGEKLGHSFSREIHQKLSNFDYKLIELNLDELYEFLKNKDFSAVNVTIPYKEKVIPFLDEIDEHARLIGAVNTIVNKGGKLYGYNTDFHGMIELLKHAEVDVTDKKVCILGTGGTSKTALAVLQALGAKKILKVSRNAIEDAITYDELYSDHTDCDVIINTTPVGMYPNNDGCPVDLSKFPSLSGVIDAVYNPLRTRLILEARKRGIPAEGGLYMLVAQAIKASELFHDVKYEDELEKSTYENILLEKESIVLIGMPSCGKTTVGRLISELCGKPFFDSDEMIIDSAKMQISEIFDMLGEGSFRDMERQVIRGLSSKGGRIIATGGGVILDPANIDALRQNGRIYFIDRSPRLLCPTSSRPLCNTQDKLLALFEERYDKYMMASDVVVDGDRAPIDVANNVIKG